MGSTGDLAYSGGHRRWTTDDVDPNAALAYWIDTICHSFLQVSIDSPVRSGFRAQLDQVDFGPSVLYSLREESQTVRRTRERISQSQQADYFLLQMRSGDVRLLQNGRDVPVQPGECVLIDCAEPYRLDCASATKSVALRLRRDWLSAWIPRAEEIVARPLTCAHGWGAALSAVLSNLDADSACELAVPAGMLAEQIAVLVALAAGPTVTAARPTGKLLGKVIETMHNRCSEWDLDPGAVATCHSISKRYLHHLFAQVQTTFCSELMRMRLQIGRRLLRDKRFNSISISEIAARCGFADPSHFARCFRKAFGQVPNAFRAGADAGRGASPDAGASVLSQEYERAETTQ